MKIKFLKDCHAPQQVHRPDPWGWYDDFWEDAFFIKGEEVDPNEEHNAINLNDLKYREDYDIIEYP